MSTDNDHANTPAGDRLSPLRVDTSINDPAFELSTDERAVRMQLTVNADRMVTPTSGELSLSSFTLPEPPISIPIGFLP
jgi:hypothetical protein